MVVITWHLMTSSISISPVILEHPDRVADDFQTLLSALEFLGKHLGMF
jgi:hypothetical protein